MQANYGLGYATFWRPIDTEHVSHNLIMMGLPMGPEGVFALVSSLIVCHFSVWQRWLTRFVWRTDWPLTPEIAKEHGLSDRGGMIFEEVLDTRTGAAWRNKQPSWAGSTGSHLGWTFQVSGRQCYCINASALHFVPDKETEAIPETCWSPCETCPQQDSCTHAKKSGCGTLTNSRWRDRIVDWLARWRRDNSYLML